MTMKSEFPAVTATLDAHASVPVEPAWINFRKIALISTFAQKVLFSGDAILVYGQYFNLQCNIVVTCI